MPLVGSIMIICGIVVLFLGILFFIIQKITWKYTAKTMGRVIGMCMNAFDYNMGNSGNVAFGIRTGSSSAGTRCPVYSYYVNGQEYRRAGSVAYNPGHIRKMMGKSVVVYYNPENPWQSSLGKINALFVMGIVFLSLGAVILIVGIILFAIGI